MDKNFRCIVGKLLLTVGVWITVCRIVLPVQAADHSRLEQNIIDSFVTEEAVDLSEERITTEELKKIASGLLYGGALPWYADWYACSYDPATGYVVEFFPKCLDKELYDRIAYEEKVDEILEETVYEGMEDWQIALAVHDYLAANFSYDETMSHYTGYDLLVEGTAVCSGYAGAYMDLMNREGIPCIMVLSDDMGHGWNLIRLGGAWYHVDVTWDDPIPDVPGRACHDFFLKTDEEMEQGQHYGWEAEICCTDEGFQDGFWDGITSQICYLDAESYLIDGVEYQTDNAQNPQERDMNSSLHQLLALLLEWLGLDSQQILMQ